MSWCTGSSKGPELSGRWDYLSIVSINSDGSPSIEEPRTCIINTLAPWRRFIHAAWSDGTRMTACVTYVDHHPKLNCDWVRWLISECAGFGITRKPPKPCRLYRLHWLRGGVIPQSVICRGPKIGEGAQLLHPNKLATYLYTLCRQYTGDFHQ